MQADRLLQAWRNDPAVDAWLVPVNPVPPGPLRHATRVKYVRTAVTQLFYVPSLLQHLLRADVVHVFSAAYTSFLLAPLPAIAMSRALGKPVLLNYRSGEAPDHFARSAVARRVIRAVDRNVVPSPFLAGVFARYGVDSTIIPNVVDLARFTYRARTPLQPRLISTRNLEPLYNVACTLRAFRLIQDRWPEATLALVGDGSQRRHLEALATHLELRGVTFTGRVPPDRIARAYAAHDIYIQSPDIDNMPTSILEAFACGLPVVSTDAGGIRVMVRDGVDALLASRDDHRQLAAHVLRLLDEPDTASALIAAASTSCHRYSWDALRPLWLDLYRAMAAQGTSGAALPRWSLES